MSYEVQQNAPGCNGWAVVDSDNGDVLSCHKTQQQAVAEKDRLDAEHDSNDNNSDSQDIMNAERGKPKDETGEPPRKRVKKSIWDGAFF